MTDSSAKPTITLLVEDFQPLINALRPVGRFPALETVLCRGAYFQSDHGSADQFRLSLFGERSGIDAPVGALTKAAESNEIPGPGEYWLCAEPVAMMADISRVMITAYGLVDFESQEISGIEQVVRQAVESHGMTFTVTDSGRWLVRLGDQPQTTLPPLFDVLGRDLGDVIDDGPDYRHWRQLMNELEMDLYASPVISNRRSKGLPVVQSVWFWGGGTIPDVSEEQELHCVFSDNPVSSGLSRLCGVRLYPVDGLSTGKSLERSACSLIDWVVDARQPEHDLRELESAVEWILSQLSSKSCDLVLRTGKHGWRYRASLGRRFWRRKQPLNIACQRFFDRSGGDSG